MRYLSRAAALAAGAALLLHASAHASSHREAPGITELPKLDGTDFYMFRSYEPGRGNNVIIVANYLPLQDPYGGPNYFSMDGDALYQIHIDNNGDGREDLTFAFRFFNTLRGISVPAGDGRLTPIPLVNIGPIDEPGDANLNVVESYTATLIRGDRDSGQREPITNAVDGSRTFLKPVDYIGTKSIPDYAAYAGMHEYTIRIPGSKSTGRMFVGQRKDPFVVNLGEVFDLVNLNPLGAENGEPDLLADKNITSIILEIPIAALTSGSDPVIGGWTAASQSRGLSARNPWIQVSRLGSPLVNEVVIGLQDKDLFNGSRPSQDALFAEYVTHPSLPVLLQALFGVRPPCTPRNDLVLAFLTGVPGLNQPANVVPAEMLRLNTAIPARAKGTQSRLGVLGNDLAGFPNGRRPGDDVVDIELRVAMGALLPLDCAPDGQLPYTDGAFVDDSFFADRFPFLDLPLPGSPN